MTSFSGVSSEDMAIMTDQLGRRPRGALQVAYHTPDGQPAVVTTAPRLDDGTPFPTLYYLTDPRLTAEASRLEVAGVMKWMTERLRTDEVLAADYRAAHDHYLSVRNSIEDLGTSFSGGGMPDRVKCLHVLMAYALAEGPDRVRLGTETVALALDHNPELRGTALPTQWPTVEELGISLPTSDSALEAHSAESSNLPNRGNADDRREQNDRGTLALAAVDCGTNSIRLLIADVDAQSGHVVREVTRKNTIVRLGEGVDSSGRLSQAAIERTRVALGGYVDRMVDHGVSAVRMVATSATRDASNRDDFFAMTRAELARVAPGAVAEVIEGTEEAHLSYLGATMDADAEGPLVVIDVGGGSTEFVVGDKAGNVVGAVSTQMGSVRLSERFLHTDPPTDTECVAARKFVDEHLHEAAEKLPLAEVATVVGCAGTFTTVSAVVQALPEYIPEKIHLSTLNADDILATTAKVRAETVEQRKARPQILPGRADVIGGGTLIIDAIVEFFRSSVGIERITVSEKDILDGIIAELARQRVSFGA